MTTLVLAPSDQLPGSARNPWRWAVDGAILGAATATLGPAIVTWTVSGILVWSSTAQVATVLGAGFGAISGLMAPRLLGFLRPRLPLGVLLVAVPAFGFWLGGLAGLVLVPTMGANPVAAWALGAFGTAIQATLVFLPYLVAAVLGLPRWPVVGAGLLVAMGTGWLCMLAIVTPGLLGSIAGGMALAVAVVLAHQLRRRQTT